MLEDVPLTNSRAFDGSRHFASLQRNLSWYAVRDHVALLSGAELTGFICDGVTEAWIDFEFHGHCFTINDQFDEYLCFVKDPDCPEALLRQVAQHFAALLQQ